MYHIVDEGEQTVFTASPTGCGSQSTVYCRVRVKVVLDIQENLVIGASTLPHE